MIEDQYGLTFRLNELTEGAIPEIFRYVNICLVKYHISGFEYEVPNIIKDSEGNIVEIKIFVTDLDNVQKITKHILINRDFNVINIEYLDKSSQPIRSVIPYKISEIGNTALITNTTTKEFYKAKSKRRTLEQFDTYFLINNFT